MPPIFNGQCINEFVEFLIRNFRKDDIHFFQAESPEWKLAKDRVNWHWERAGICTERVCLLTRPFNIINILNSVFPIFRDGGVGSICHRYTAAETLKELY